MSCKHVGKLYFNMMNDPGSNTFTRMGIVLSSGHVLFFGTGFISDVIHANWFMNYSSFFYVDDFMCIRNASSKENQAFIKQYSKAK